MERRPRFDRTRENPSLSCPRSLRSRAAGFLSVLLLCLVLSAACAGDRRTRERPEATGQNAGWLARAQEQITAREYRASENGKGLQAPNRAHNLRTYFEPVGIRVHDRTAGGQPQLVELRLNGVGRGKSIKPVAPGQVIHHEGRIEIHRPGLVEWYVNSA